MPLAPADSAAIATRVFMDDLRERQGFLQLIEGIGDWSKIEAFMQGKVAAALTKAEMDALPTVATSEIAFE